MCRIVGAAFVNLWSGLVSDTFQQLLARAQQGDRDAIGTLYVTYLPHIERVVGARLRKLGLERVTTTADVGDSVFCQLLKPGALNRVTSERHLRHFLFKACRNKLHDIGVKSHWGADVASHPETGDEGTVPQPGDGPPSIELEEQLDRLYAELTSRERLLCTLRRAGFSWKEIGLRLQLSPAVARQAFSRAFRRIRALTEEAERRPAEPRWFHRPGQGRTGTSPEETDESNP